MKSDAFKRKVQRNAERVKRACIRPLHTVNLEPLRSVEARMPYD